MRPYGLTTGTGTPALVQVHSQAAALLGVTVAAVEAFYLKFWWAHNLTGPEVPVIGTTVPDLVIQVPSTGIPPIEFNHPLQGGGPLWVAATKNLVYTDDTALTTGGDIITLFLD